MNFIKQNPTAHKRITDITKSSLLQKNKEGSQLGNQLKLPEARDEYMSQVLPKTYTGMRKKKRKNEHEAVCACREVTNSWQAQ